MAGINEGQVKVQGLKELQRVLRKLPPGVVDELKNLHAEAAKPVEARARTLTPKRTGRLANTLRSSGTRKSGTVRAGYKSVPYAGPINFGWPDRNIRGQHFMERALDQRRGDVIRVMEDGLGRWIDKRFAELPK